jgi:hypothetical protein
LRYLPIRFDPKISSLEEKEDIGTLSMDELHGIFIAYEMIQNKRTQSKNNHLSRHPRRQRGISRKIQK